MIRTARIASFLFGILVLAGSAGAGGDCGNQDTDNRPNICDGNPSTCEELGDGSCKYTHCDGQFTKTYNWDNCCCVTSKECPPARYVAICLGFGSFQVWYEDGISSISYLIQDGLPNAEYTILSETTGTILLPAGTPPVLTDADGFGQVVVPVACEGDGHGTFGIEILDPDGILHSLNIRRCFMCEGAGTSPVEQDCVGATIPALPAWGLVGGSAALLAVGGFVLLRRSAVRA